MATGGGHSGWQFPDRALALRGSFTLVLASIAATLALGAVVQLQEATYKTWAVVVLIGILPAIVAITGRPKEILLFGWIFSLTYNRQYWSFEAIVGNNGLEGPYWMVSDFFLAGLFALWIFEAAVHKVTPQAKGARVWLWYLPFAFVCLLSALPALRPDWTMYEMIRVLKVFLVLFYVRYNVGRREWWLCFAAMGCALFVQSAIGIKEVATGRVGVIGSAELPAEIPENLREETYYGWIRAQGTMSHPPYLASYMLMTLPALLAVSLTARRRRAILCATAFLTGVVGLACTLSRWPWALALVQCSVVLAGLVLFRDLPLKRAAGLVTIGLFALAAALFPLRDKFTDRIVRDWDDSLKARQDAVDAAFRIIEENPVLGIGLNNSILYIPKYLPEMEVATLHEDLGTKVLHLRAPVTIGNGLFYVAVETGLLGFLAFLVYIAGAFAIGLRAILRLRGEIRAASLGLVLGLAGILAEQVIDAPLWVDPNLFTFTLIIGMLGNASYLDRQTAATPARLEPGGTDV